MEGGKEREKNFLESHGGLDGNKEKKSGYGVTCSSEILVISYSYFYNLFYQIHISDCKKIF